MKELDLLLGSWLERRFETAGGDLQRSFQWLLEQPDTDIAAWLIGGTRPGNRGHAALVDDILRRPD